MLALRADARALAAAEAKRLRRVVAIAERVTRETRAFLALGGRVPGAASDTELVMSAVTGELMMALGIGKGHAESLQLLATRLVRVLPETLAMLESGRLDLTRARLLAEATEVLDDAHARQVQAAAPAGGGERAVGRAVAAGVAGPGPARGDHGRPGLGPAAAGVRDPVPAGAGVGGRGRHRGDRRSMAATPTSRSPDRVITDLAHAWPTVGPDGEPLSMDQRRADAVMDLFRRVADGNELPWMSPRRDREVGIVLHADTLFGDGPAKDAPGELRGLGAPAPIDPHSAAALARDEIDAGAATRVLLVDGDGVLQRTLRLPKAPPGGWTRDLLIGQVRDALPDLPDCRPSPTSRRWRSPTTSEPCTRAAPPMTAPASQSRCDLDHDESWPRGPTCVTNLCPRCRRHHELKTRGLVRTRLHPDGSVTTTTLLGTTVTTRPEPCPASAPARPTRPCTQPDAAQCCVLGASGTSVLRRKAADSCCLLPHGLPAAFLPLVEGRMPGRMGDPPGATCDRDVDVGHVPHDGGVTGHPDLDLRGRFEHDVVDVVGLDATEVFLSSKRNPLRGYHLEVRRVQSIRRAHVLVDQGPQSVRFNLPQLPALVGRRYIGRSDGSCRNGGSNHQCTYGGSGHSGDQPVAANP